MRTKFSGILTLVLALVVQFTFAQQKTITGTVMDDTGLPLPGANVIIKGTSSGTQTDFDGKYSISANVGQTIAFSYVGFNAKEVKVGAQNTMDVTLQPDAAALEEVVVTGYSTRNQTVQTSAVVSISASEISQMSPTTSVDNLLQGKAAGVQVTAANGKPGQGAFVRIRGQGSLTAGASSPLYVVDGAPIREEELNNIPNEDIENITILKDAATTARYGSRGSNGVVVITTKNGNRNKDATVRFSSRYGTTSRIQTNYTLMNTEEKFQFESEMYSLGVSAAATLPGVAFAPGSTERQFLLENSTDWEKLIYKDGIVENNNVSISGGSEKSDYYFSVGHDKNTGIIDKIDGYSRLNTRLNLNINPKEWLDVGINVGYSRSLSDEPRDRNNVQNPFRAAMDYAPYETEYVIDEDGNFVLDENGDQIFNSAIHSAGGFNVRGALETEPSKDIENLTLGSIDAVVKFTKNWNYGFNISVNHLNRRIERYSEPDGILDRILHPGVPTGRKTDATTQRLDMTVSNRLNYNLNSNNHNLNVLGLYEYNFNELNFIRAVGEGYSSPLLTTLQNATNILNLDTDNVTKLTTSNRDRLTLISYGAFADYDYKEKYLASASIRRDGSSNFGKDFQYGTFWSASLGWNLAKEDFFSVDAINDLKLRGAYGTVGNRSGIGRYDPLGTVKFSNYNGDGATVPDNVANPNLKWETTTTLDVGLEFNLFNNRVRGVADYFTRKTEDLLFRIPRAAESGIADVTGNLGTIQNNGLEFSLAADIFKSSNFKWTLGGNIYIQTKSEIVELPNGLDQEPNTFNILYREGVKINEHYLIRYAGVDPNTGRAQYLNAEGETVFSDALTADDRVFQGKSTIADKEGGFFTDFNYKGFGLRADFVYKFGNWVYDAVRADREFSPYSSTDIKDNMSVGAFNYWQQPGDTDVLPNPIYRNESLPADSDQYLAKGDYVRMRNVTLSYNFSRDILEKTPISSFRIYVQGQNLLTFSKFWGDPEVGLASGETIAFGDVVAPGELTLYSYPNTKSIQVGFDVSF